MDENISFPNMDSWRGSSGKFGLTFKQIVIMHINRCVLNGSVEWHGGYWNETGNNPVTRTYVHNSREVFCNSVKMLRACLLVYFDDKIKEKDKKIQKEISESYEKGYDPDDFASKKSYYKQKIDLHIFLFEELIKLSKRLNFFEEETTEEEM